MQMIGRSRRCTMTLTKNAGMKPYSLLKDGKTIIVTVKDLMNAVGLSESAARARLKQETDWHKAFKKRGQHGDRIYTLSDGNDYTINQLLEISGVNRNTLYARLHKRGQRDYAKVTKSTYKKPWVNTPQTVINGFVLDPEYLDGRLVPNEMVGTTAMDRHGNAMTDAERGALMRYREAQRAAWLKTKQEGA